MSGIFSRSARAERYSTVSRGDFELRKEDTGLLQYVEIGVEVGGFEARICPGDYDDGVFAIDIRCDEGNPGGHRHRPNPARVDAGPFKSFSKVHRKRIGAHFSDHADRATQPSGCDGLVGTLSPWKGLKAMASHGFSGAWDTLGACNQVEINAADNYDSLCHW